MLRVQGDERMRSQEAASDVAMAAAMVPNITVCSLV